MLTAQTRSRPWLVGALALVLALVGAPPTAQAESTWPSPTAYGRAMAMGGRYICDRRLQGATVKMDAQQRPIACSGSFSSVFHVQSRSGREIALRVFHPPATVTERQDVEALGRRYQRLGDYLGQLAAARRAPPEIVEFAWVPRGVQVNGRTYPILKMPWLEARTLDSWIDRRLAEGRSTALRTLARNWRAVLRDLAAVHVAHGDLHHGNIVLERGTGRPRFIDYDAMYAPPLAGLTSSEVGHPNYQHPSYHFPEPRPRPFDEKMDHFSSIVIYLSFLALADDPGLWRRYHEEGNNLIFRGREDFVNPAASPLFGELRRSGNVEVQGLARRLAHYCTMDPRQVPTLDEAIREAAAEARPWYR